ncbi:MAG: phosphonate metabolism protein/1,5-bisphosphokinase (PRPP-forming) PhnN [Mesorhizobium sp.]
MSSDGASAREGSAGRGTLIAVVGPSGAGKDSLLTYARERLGADPATLFVRRVITRPAAIDAEDHASLSVDAFLAAQAAGLFAVAWEAHGLHYAIPATVHRHLASGGVAVVNGSRAALPAIRSAFGHVVTVQVTCRPDILAARLAARGREDIDHQQARLARSVAATEASTDTVRIDNSDDLATAGDAFVAAIRGYMDDRQRASPAALRSSSFATAAARLRS